ncbi:M15 family metallopeptidase [Caloramator sp. E03]|uniref:M15 family metallopeptidase n=1 Tax=Caloramator sp. E03 TaxID=2576307 RepID=UPI0011106C73|nr:M15 family metallopeptidase [Caloramator sp. E03]
MIAYPSYIRDAEYKNGFIYIVMNSGKKILYDDKKKKSVDERLSKADIQDMMEQIYPLNFTGQVMDNDFDPGRARCYALFKYIYGSSKSEIESNLIIIKTLFGSFQFNKKNNASLYFQNAINEIALIAKKNDKIRKFIIPISGTFNYRYISGTNNLSAHSFGIAVDLAANKDDYWRWTLKDKAQIRLQSYPKEIVSAFENNFFIWGGKWGHFDIMHYEYRPEIILKAKYFGNNIKDSSVWYGSISYKEYKDYIDTINRAF